MNQGARDENERIYRHKIIGLLERIAAKLEESAPSASTNNAMVPCPKCGSIMVCMRCVERELAEGISDGRAQHQ